MGLSRPPPMMTAEPTFSSPFPSSSAWPDSSTPVLLSTGKRHSFDEDDSSDSSDSASSSGSSETDSGSSRRGGSEKERERRRKRRLRRRPVAVEQDSGGASSSFSVIIVLLAFLLIVTIGVAVYFGVKNLSAGKAPSSTGGVTGGTGGSGGTGTATKGSTSGSDSSPTSGSGKSVDDDASESSGTVTASKTNSPSAENDKPSITSSGDSSPTQTATTDAPQSTSTAPVNDDPFIQDCLTGHNDFRAKHHADPLTWNATLADAASRWIEKCTWEHSGGVLLSSGYGENLFGVAPVKEDAAPDAIGGINGWNDEVKMHGFDPPMGFTHETGHFTQVVWKGTTQVGCAMRPCKGLFQPGEFGNYLVCEYAPPGNYLDQFKENVLPE